MATTDAYHGTNPVIVPVPYTSEEMCNKAAEYVYEASCIPQPLDDVKAFGYAHYNPGGHVRGEAYP
jgi:hypothetical protein